MDFLVLDSKYPTVLSELYNEESGSLLRGELLQKCEDVFQNVTLKLNHCLLLACWRVTFSQFKASSAVTVTF
jgi:hypothetical protein